MKVNRHPFDELVIELRKHGYGESADDVATLMRSAWSSSSEYIGELGQAVLRFQRAHPIVAPDLRNVLDRRMREVRIVWPEIR